jgi:hypothetical protein
VYLKIEVDLEPNLPIPYISLIPHGQVLGWGLRQDNILHTAADNLRAGSHLQVRNGERGR